MRYQTGIWVFFLVIMPGLMTACKKTGSGVSNPVAPPPVASAGKSFYVSDANGSDANTGLAENATFKTISAGINAAAQGDTVFVMNGTYTAAVNITRSGAPGAYITIKAYPSHSPRIYISGNNWNAFTINGSYVVLEGIELQGDNGNITYAEAYTAYTAAVAGGSPNGKYNTNGINIGGPGTNSKLPHHILIRNCKVHDFPGGGISAIQADYITIEGNTVYNNAWYMMYAGSGISILTPVNSDAGSSQVYKNFVRNNIVYSNKTTIPWVNLKPAALSDGNGIIIDVNQTGYTGTGVAFNGRTLVENNVSFNNGGSGIHAFKADHVDIVNNTTYGNGTMVGYADIFANSSTDVRIANNIMYARAGGRCNAAPAAGTFVTYDYNIYYNGSVAVMGTHDKVTNPQFVNASLTGNLANYSLNSSSPGIDAGTKIIFSATDIKGIARPQGAGVDCGAYEFK